MKLQDEARPYDTINVTPMLDLAYVLLVVFILMTTATVQGIGIGLPKPSATPSTERHELHVLRVGSDGAFSLDGTPKTDEQLSAELGTIVARDRKATVVVQGDDRSPYGRVVAAIDISNQAGIGMSLATARIGF
ncbi:MAG: ExbD/TolR family protein [Aquabacterium sp.]